MIGALSPMQVPPDPLAGAVNSVATLLHIDGAIERPLSSVAAKAGMETQMFIYISCMLLAVPLGWLYRMLPSNAGALRHAFSIVVSLWFCAMALRPWDWVPSLATALLTYALAALVPRRFVAAALFIACFGVLTAMHVQRFVYEYLVYRLDFTGPQMMLTLKIVAFGFCLRDGAQPKEKLSESQRKYAVSEMPALLEWLGFVYFFPSFLAGPPIEMRDYQRLCDGSLFGAVGYKPHQAPLAVLPALRKIVEFVAWSVVYIVVGSYFALSYGRVATAWFATLPLYRQVLYMSAAGTVERAKYYAAWMLSEASFISTGISFAGFDAAGRIRWDGYRNITWTKVEFACNPRDLFTYWNQYTADWLRRYIYERAPAFLPPTLATFLTSGIWHGIYPGYIVAFGYFGFVTMAARDARRLFRPLFLAPWPLKRLYDVLGWFVSRTLCDFGGFAHLLMGGELVLAYMRNMHWAPLHALLIAFFGVKLLSLVMRPKREASSSDRKTHSQ